MPLHVMEQPPRFFALAYRVRQKLNWSGITPQKAKIKLEWYYSPKGKN
jgi:hypothetical protein